MTDLRWGCSAAIRSGIVLAVLSGFVACGDGGGGGTRHPPMPRTGNSQFGAAGNLLASDRVPDASGEKAELWIGFDREDEWKHYLDLRTQTEAGRLPSVGGRVVADPERELGFYFDPATTFTAEVVAGGFGTTLRAISRDPAGAAAAGHPWVVAIVAERVVTTGQ